jgi:hypothetical protein
MAVSCDLVQAYAEQYLPQFNFTIGERIFPVSTASWLEQCAQGDWPDPTDPHRGTAVVEAPQPMQAASLRVLAGCQGIGGAPIDVAQPLPSLGKDADAELFMDFAGWESLESGDGLVTGDNTYIFDYYSQYAALFNPAIAANAVVPPVRNIPQPLTEVQVICEAAWAGDFTRMALAKNCQDFASGITTNPNTPVPDPWLDQFLVLSYYLFYPASEPAPGSTTAPALSPNRLTREGQWEAVSCYFTSTSRAAPQTSADVDLPADPATQPPAYAVYSQGITHSGDGRGLSGLAASYPGLVGTYADAIATAKDLNLTVVSEGGATPGFTPQVFVTQGTHKNLFKPTPVRLTTSPDPGDQAAGAALEGIGGAAIGAGGPIGILLGALAILAGFLLQLFGTDSTSTPEPDSSGDIAEAGGPAATGNKGASSAPTGSNGAVPIDLTVISTLAGDGQCAPPPWWGFPGRWGVAVTSGEAGWDSGGRLMDFQGRNRAYWNTVALQSQVPH